MVLYPWFLALLSTSDHSGAGIGILKSERSKLIPVPALTSSKFVFFTLVSEFSLNYSMSTFLFPCCEVKTAKDIA